MAKSIATIQGEGVQGVLKFEQASESQATVIQGEVDGLKPGKHGLALCVFGDISKPPASLGGHFNPFSKNHGAPEDEHRHVGSLGNITVGDNGKAVVHVTDKLVKLIGPQSVIGRSIAIMESEDDLGRGGHEKSLVNGAAGNPVAWGVIGLIA